MLFRAVTRLEAAVVMTDEAVAVVAAGVSVTVPAVTPETEIVNRGKSVKPENVLELEVWVTVAPPLV
jgi:hypothetical protein